MYAHMSGLTEHDLLFFHYPMYPFDYAEDNRHATMFQAPRECI